MGNGDITLNLPRRHGAPRAELQGNAVGFMRLDFKISYHSARLYFLQTFLILKGTVQPELRGVKIGINRTAMKICVAGKCRLSCPKGHHHERSINILGGCSTF
jgi:hypothetical protein